jgi:hypothetical protein
MQKKSKLLNLAGRGFKGRAYFKAVCAELPP